MLRTPLFCVLVALTAAPGEARDAVSADDARAVVNRSVAAMGGEAALHRISTMRLQTLGHEFFIEQSERPEGPFIV